MVGGYQGLNAMEPTSVVHSPAFAHHGVSWSPFYENRIAIAASANYGLIGNGRMQVVSLGGTPAMPTGANIDKMFVCCISLP
jgi:peroxin-7